MIRQIEAKVVNRLRQVTSAIKQDGANQVSIITSTADRQAAVEFAKADAIRPAVVGGALNKIAQDPQIAAALFEILELQKLMEAKTRITLVPAGGGGLLPMLLAARPGSEGRRCSCPPRPSKTKSKSGTQCGVWNAEKKRARVAAKIWTAAA